MTRGALAGIKVVELATMVSGPYCGKLLADKRKDDVHHEGAKKGIAMGPINSAKDMMTNEQYAAKGYFVEVDHPEAGKHRYAGWPYQMSATPPRVGRPAPLLGEHNNYVLQELLGLSQAEVDNLRKKEVIM